MFCICEVLMAGEEFLSLMLEGFRFDLFWSEFLRMNLASSESVSDCTGSSRNLTVRLASVLLRPSTCLSLGLSTRPFRLKRRSSFDPTSVRAWVGLETKIPSGPLSSTALNNSADPSTVTPKFSRPCENLYKTLSDCSLFA